MKRFFVPIALLVATLTLLTACGPQIPEGFALVTVTPAAGGDTTAAADATPAAANNPQPAPTTAIVTSVPANNNTGSAASDPNLDLPLAAEGRIAFMGSLNQSQAIQVFVANADGTGLTHISQTNGEGFYPSLSPDGNKVLMVATGETTPDIFVVDVATGESTNLTNKAGTDNQPLWSPDGASIAFVSDREGGDQDIWIMDADGANPRRMARTPGGDTLGGWNSDSTQIVYSNRNELGESLWIADVATGETTALIEMLEGNADSSPTWSPDGNEIAFYRSTNGGTPILFTVTPDGETLNPVTDGSMPSIFPVYSPDGKWLLYTSINGETQTMMALERATNKVTAYPDITGFATSWAATGTTLADTGLTQGPKNTGVEISPAVMEISYRRGSDDAPVKIVEFSDFQCPFCEKWYKETYSQLRPYIDDGTVQLIFVDYPLSFHPQADEAAQAARCVGELGGDDAYWLMHDKLFESLSTWNGQTDPGPIFNDLADSIGVDGDAVEGCMDSLKYVEQVQLGMNEGNRLGVSGTPTFFINGNRLVGAQPWSAFEQYIQQAGGGQ